MSRRDYGFWDNFRQDVGGWITDPGVIFALAVSLIMFLLVWLA